MYYHIPEASTQSICLEIASESTSIVNLQEKDLNSLIPRPGCILHSQQPVSHFRTNNREHWSEPHNTVLEITVGRHFEHCPINLTV